MVPGNANLQNFNGGAAPPPRGMHLCPLPVNAKEILTLAAPPPLAPRPPQNSAVRPNGTSSGPPVSRTQCKNCHLYHPQDRQCPNLKTEIQLRLALDQVKSLSGGDAVKAQQNREILQNLLRAKRQGSTGAAAVPPAQPSPQPQLLIPSPVVPQITQQPQPQLEQPRLVAPPQSEGESSGSDESTSEEGSESESEDIGAGSGPNAGSEQAGHG